MKVLVTGASGNVGRYVVTELLKKGEEVVTAGTNPSALEKQFGKGVDTVKLDFTDHHTFSQVLEKVDRVFLIRPPHLGKPEAMYPFIDAMKAHQIKLVSFLSLMGIETNTIPPHYKIEKYIEKSNLPYAHIRPGFFMQNISGVHAEEIKWHQQVFVPAGKSKTSFIDAQDIGLAIATVLHNPNKYENTAHTITGSEALDYTEIAKTLSEVTGVKIHYAKPGFLKYRKYYLQTRKLSKEYVNVTVALYFMTRMGTAKHVTNDFYLLTGKTPRTFKDFARSNRECFIEEERENERFTRSQANADKKGASLHTK